MTTFNWTISTLEYDLTTDNSVITAHWRCTATDDGGEYSAGSYGTCGFSADPGWCFADGIDQEATEASLQVNIDLQMTPVQASGVPW
jgi:hypothetical protein